MKKTRSIFSATEIQFIIEINDTFILYIEMNYPFGRKIIKAFFSFFFFFSVFVVAAFLKPVSGAAPFENQLIKDLKNFLALASSPPSPKTQFTFLLLVAKRKGNSEMSETTPVWDGRR